MFMQLMALALVLEGGSPLGAAIAVVTGEHHALAAAAADNAAIFNRVAAGAMDQHADAEIADLKSRDLDALCIADRQPRIGGRAHIGAELARHGAGAGALALVHDKTRSVDRDELARAFPRTPLDADRSLDRRQERSGLDDMRPGTGRIDLDAEAARRRVVALDRPAQRALDEIVSRARDAQHLDRSGLGERRHWRA